MSRTPKIEPVEFQPTTQPKERKEWRDPEGSIIRKKETRRDSKGNLKEVEIIYARVRYTDRDGVPREKKRRAPSAKEAVQVRRNLQIEIENELKQLEADEIAAQKPKTFSEILDYFETEFVKAAVIVGDQKIDGYKEDLDTIRRQIELFRNEFGSILASKITYDEINRFKIKRLGEPIITEYYEKIELTASERAALPKTSRRRFRYIKKTATRHRKHSSVHRELSRLRRIFNVALRQGFVSVNPFARGESLIQPGMESSRLRICSFEEERLILVQCAGKRAHLKAIIHFALDTAMRKGEIFKLLWGNVDFANRRIFVKATNTKTGKSRFVPITNRVKELIEPLRENRKDTERVFGIATDADRAWDSATEAAGIDGLTFHDLRATAITRMLRAGMQEAEVMKISGHTQYSTFLKYVRQDETGSAASADKMDAYLDAQKPSE